MREFDFEWDPRKARSNRSKHRVSFEEATEVFRDRLALSRFDDEHAEREERWVTLGAGASGSLLVVVHTFQELGEGRFHVRIVSARQATRRERRMYEG